MRVTALLFAAAREAAGAGTVSLDLAEGATVADAFARLVDEKPALAGVVASCRAAVDEEFAPRDARLRDGATLAVLPPVSGG